MSVTESAIEQSMLYLPILNGTEELRIDGTTPTRIVDVYSTVPLLPENLTVNSTLFAGMVLILVIVP